MDDETTNDMTDEAMARVDHCAAIDAAFAAERAVSGSTLAVGVAYAFALMPTRRALHTELARMVRESGVPVMWPYTLGSAFGDLRDCPRYEQPIGQAKLHLDSNREIT